jgi:heat shock protein HslJ
MAVAGRRWPALSIAVLTLSLLACGSGDDAAPAGETPLPLEGTPWQLTSYVGDDGSESTVPDGVTATARFSDGQVTGNGGCNSFTAGYTVDATVDPATLQVGEVASTLMACPGPREEVEAGYLAALRRVASYHADPTTLTLVDANDDVLLTFVEADQAPLVGTAWSASMINNGSGGVTSLVAGSEVTAEFGEDGTVTGTGGCNRYNGPFTAEGETIAVGPLATTRRACPEPAGVDAQEAAFVSAVERATRYTIDGTTLELRDDEGALQVSFEATTS